MARNLPMGNLPVATTGDRPPRVLVIFSMVKHYRIPFYEGLHATLREQGVTLRVAYGQPRAKEALINDTVPLDPKIGVIVPTHWLLSQRIIYQSVLKHLLWADMVIVEQATKYVMNYPLVLAGKLGLKRVAFWGHGWNHERGPGGLSERIKRFAVPHCDWWFAYTQETARYIASQGMDPRRITVVENTVDTQALAHDIAALSPADVAGFRASLGIPDGARVGVYSGALTPRKHMPFLLEAARRIKAEVPDFHLLILGDGPERPRLEAAAADTDWIHALGPTFGREKALCYALSQQFLCPGLVGLAIIDGFTAGLPLITSDIPIHSPEIVYLNDGENGLYLPHDPAEYGAAAAALFNDPARLEQMRAAALASAAERPMSRMVDNFATGVLGCLGRPVMASAS